MVGRYTGPKVLIPSGRFAIVKYLKDNYISMPAAYLLMSILELETPYDKRKALLALYGVMIVLPTAYIGYVVAGLILSPALALVGGLSAVCFVGGVLGFSIILLQQAVQEVNIKVIQE